MNLRRDVPIVVAALPAIAGGRVDGDGRCLHYIAKPLTTLLIAAIAWRANGDPGYRRAILAGMALSCIGDFALMLPFDAFVPGLVAFLLAHLCYIVAFRAGFKAGRALVLSAALLAVFAGSNLIGLWPLLPNELKIPVVAYVLVLALMATLAIARGPRFAAVGAVFFVISDCALAWDRFGGGIPPARLVVLSAYYLAQYCIARSVSR